jgi:hypothetical protein
MAKKKDDQDKAASKADEIIDDLARDVGAPADAASAPASAATARAGDKGRPAAGAHVETMSQMLMSQGAEVDPNSMRAAVERFVDPAERKRGSTNLLLLVVIAVCFGGGWFALSKLASADAIKAKLAEKEQIEQRHREEMIAKMKKYGSIKVESNPPGAIVIQDKNPKKCLKKDAASGNELQCQTPLDIANLDIKELYEFRLELLGYEPFEFTVAEHLWAKAPGAEDYVFQKTVELVPSACEYWFTFDAKAKKEMKYTGETSKADCGTFVAEQAKKQNVVPPCTCKPLIPGAPISGAPSAAPKP